MIVTKKQLSQARTKRGGYTQLQKEIMQRVTGEKRRAKALVNGKNVPETVWGDFVKAREYKLVCKPGTIINSMSGSDDWAWRPEKIDIPDIIYKGGKLGKNRGKNKKNKRRVSRQDSKSFYASPEWRKLRVRVLEKYGARCMCCGRNHKDHGVVIHVDHIKPRSKHPELSLVFENLQILCEDCNLGKSNLYDTDWRPERWDMSEMEILIEANLRI